jgi:SAM-dependent methyltransferase
MEDRTSVTDITAHARQVARPAGWLDSAVKTDAGWRLGGWMRLPRGQRFDSVAVYRGSERIGLASQSLRPDLRPHLYWMRHPEESGVEFTLPESSAAGRIDVVGHYRGEAIAHMPAAFAPPDRERAPLPPEGLTKRSSSLSPEAFRLSGLKAYADVWDAISRYKGDPRGLKILDWGCGCGRISRYLPPAGVTDLHGCDIDPEALAWCAANLGGAFTLCDTAPPLPYPGGEFDIIFASSVFTHLSDPDQQAWLDELARVLAPEGILLASVAGQYAYSLGTSRLLRLSRAPGSPISKLVVARKRDALRRSGMIDDFSDPALDGIAPAGYYRDVYQTEAFVRERWTRRFAVVDYIEQGLAGHLDVAVLRPKQ